MSTYSLSHLSDQALLRELAALVAQERATTAVLLAHLAEVDARRLYLPAAYPSMYAYCVEELGMSEDAAYKRIQATRTARRFPAIFAALAEGRLHLSGVVLLAPHLTPENADELLAAAAGKHKSEIEVLLAQRFPRSELLPMVQPLPAVAPRPHHQLAPGQVESPERGEGQLAQGRVGPPAPRAKVAPLAPERFALQVTIEKETHDNLRYAQALLGHRIRSGDVAQVLDRALHALIEKLERTKFAATRRPLSRPRLPSTDPRHIPAHVKRAVWERDGGQCSFVSDSGQRCPARARLEFDHAVPVAHGGRATVEGIRIRCQAHNQYEAECTFGAAFMDRKRQEARDAAAARARALTSPPLAGRVPERAEAEQSEDRGVIPWLRRLGFRADEARRAAAPCESIPEASLEERLRLALRHLAPPHRRVDRPPVTVT